MKKTVRELYEDYRDEMASTLSIVERLPEHFDSPAFARQFEKKVERLDTLIALYADLLASNKN